MDLGASYFAEAFAAATAAIEERAKLLRAALDHQIRAERHVISQVGARTQILRHGPTTKIFQPSGSHHNNELVDPQLDLEYGMSRADEGYPALRHAGLDVQLVPMTSGEARATDLLEFFTSASLAWHVDLLVEDAQKHITELLVPDTGLHAAT